MSNSIKLQMDWRIIKDKAELTTTKLEETGTLLLHARGRMDVIEDLSNRLAKNLYPELQEVGEKK